MINNTVEEGAGMWMKELTVMRFCSEVVIILCL
jgi:hypothetical protein